MGESGVTINAAMVHTGMINTRMVDTGMIDKAIGGPASMIERARAAQARWAATSVRDRLKVMRKFRHSLAEAAEVIAATVPAELPGSLHRCRADTLVAEVLPLLEACRFLERESEKLLAPRKPGSASRPFWLRGVETEIHREPLGIVLIIGPGNYPLFLPGVQALQAVAAGNAVLWKPAPGGTAAATTCRLLLIAAGLEPLLLQILEEAPDAAAAAIRTGVDKVVLTGSRATGRAVMRDLAERLTPSVMELSGCDAVFVLPGADLARVVAAITFGLRLNGSATCMAPRRVFVTKAVAKELTEALAASFRSLGPVHIPDRTSDLLQELMFEAETMGAKFILNGFNQAVRAEGGGTLLHPTLVAQATPGMRITQTDIFAPLLSVIEVGDEEEALAANQQCPYALTASVFGPRHQARRLAVRIPAGTVLINDIIVSTADPRAPFGGRRQSGFGATRGHEGLLEMTTLKTIQTQKAKDLRAYAPLAEKHESFVSGYIMAAHGRGRRQRLHGLRQFLKAMIKLK
jgi:acyl-CoA reductase-like NAD-dependent aldehyde dehydrogenase